MFLVIVESPTKAKTIQKFLEKNFKVESSYGHIRDLPKAEMGIDIENNFQPRYVIPTKKRKIVSSLKKEIQKTQKIILATDEDREGEAIAWHLVQALDLKEKSTERIVFHEITEEAIKEALKNPRQININLVDAQQARRLLDRLVGYELSPFLWRKVAKGLSAGRVQSVAVRLIVERERDIQKFVSQKYWSIDALFSQKEKQISQDQNLIFPAKLSKIEGKKLDRLALKNKEEAEKILKDLENANYYISEIYQKTLKKIPPPPFTTSTLQQEANRRLKYSAKMTMRMAQQLYEGIEMGGENSVGLITYMRTDSVNLSVKFLEEAKNYIKKYFGDNYSLNLPRQFKTKSKLAQEAHEAIRPTDINRSPTEIKQLLTPQQYKLYNLIWQRALASQMAEAMIDSTLINIINNNQKYTFQATGSVIKFDGFLKLYPQEIKDSLLPELKEKEELKLEELKTNEHTTQPPARYSDAGLVKALEEYGIGRPSTYAPTISTIIERGYVAREERRLKPMEIAFLVNDLLVEHFPEIVDYKFTAHLEDDLDKIAAGESQWLPIIKEFYKPFKENIMKKEKQISKKDLTEEKTDEVCQKCQAPMIIKMGRYGKFLACSNFPECRHTRPLGDHLEPKLSQEKCEKCGALMQFKMGRYGKFLGCSNYPQCKNIKPLNKSTGVKCPECQKGEIVEKKSKKGRTFYACDQYPDCQFALWSLPTGEKCPSCGSLMVKGKNDSIVCSNKECQD